MQYRKISQKFPRRDFSSPAKIQGEGIPGLAELRKAEPSQFHVGYKPKKSSSELSWSFALSKVEAWTVY